MKDPNPKVYSISYLGREIGVSINVIEFWLEEFEDIGFSCDTDGRLTESAWNLGKLIRRLIYEEGFTLRGAKRRLRDFDSNFLDTRFDMDINDDRVSEHLGVLKHEVEEMLELIKKFK
ncbi:MerR family transcriptional regulator [Myxococcota bacterium]|nr:MerR family transcriptional regulator [Myxococcota bacterium]MBU1382399.1 MerR family transcriptional regulator [Myxococcota bacterium]MBU1495942.1 MerR family transcriptional regulator [Myxococcota bacterium]